MASPEEFPELGLSILGMGVQYPSYHLPTSALDTLAARHYPQSPAYV
jgi:fungal type III polyketide synthase